MNPSITRQFADLMQLPVEIAINEAKSKLTETYIFVNKELYYVIQIGANSLILTSRDSESTIVMDGTKIESLDFFLPKCGIYLTGSSYSFLYRTARRQWKKSFSWNSYGAGGVDINLFDIVGKEPLELYPLNNRVMYYDMIIGTIGPKGIRPARKGFEFELDLFRRFYE